ncbi:MAG TPA: glycosyltransferase [Planctomycetota bacterium]|nr:glycosyltransferase [Planctomycetota bacterium]
MTTGVEFSVVICTCGRLEGLRVVLEGLAACEGAREPGWEVVVVDNRPAAETETLVRGYEGRLPVRYVPEPVPGSSSARNRGVVASRGETIWYLDDDLKLGSGWLSAARSAVREQPGSGFYGGRLFADWGNVVFPDWFDKNECRHASPVSIAGKYDLGDAPRLLSSEEIALEANMGVRRGVFAAVGGFRTDMGILPHRPRGFGEGPDLLVRARAAGFQGFYVPSASAHHFGDSARIRVGYVLAWAYSMGRRAQQTKVLHQLRHGGFSSGFRLVEIARAVLRLPASLPLALLGCWFVGKRRRVGSWMVLSRKLGRLAECFAVTPDLALDWPEGFPRPAKQAKSETGREEGGGP